MKSFLTFGFLLFLFCNAFAQKQIDVKSDLVSATVYLSGAELNRKATVSLPAGSTDIVFTDLPANLNPQTVNVSAEGKLVVQSTQFKQNYMEPGELTTETRKWRDSLDVINKALTRVKDRKDILIMETQLLEQNRVVSGANTGMNFQTMQQFHDYYVQTNTENKRKWREEEETERQLNEIKTRLTQQLSDYNQKRSQPDGQIHLKVFADAAVTAKFNITYVVSDAGWAPEYDLRAENVNSPVKLTYKASLWQNTNEDWKNLKLKLSTGNPTVSNTGPNFVTWMLNYYYAGVINTMEIQSVAKPSVQQDRSEQKGEDANYEPAQTGADYTTVNNNQLAVVFDISIPYSIPSDGQPHTVNIQEYQLPATYAYYTMPRIDPDVFLSARIADWEKLNLMPGNASVFFQNAYVGQTYVDPNSTTDTLDVSLGRDKKIIVRREKAKDFTKSRIIGSAYKQTVAYDISIKNTKSEAVTVKVIDQYPVSANSEIEIELEDSGNALVEAETGKLTWIVTLPPNGEQKMRYSFSVKFPEKKRGVYAPRF